MFVMLTVASICAVALIAGLVALMCRHPGTADLWIVSDDAILCLVAPVLIILIAFGIIALSWRLTHGGFAAITAEAWLGSAAIVAISFGIWVPLARKIRATGKQQTGVRPTATPTDPEGARHEPYRSGGTPR